MDLSKIANNFNLWYNEFLEWYLAQPIYGQILVIIGIVALLTLIITLVYYLMKGIGYLIYYALKGVYYLLKGIGFGFYKLCESFYYLIAGKPKPKTQIQHEISQNKISYEHSEKSKRLMEVIQPNIRYCTIMYCNECGSKFSEKIHNNLKVNGVAFCVHCGKRFVLNERPKTSISIYH